MEKRDLLTSFLSRNLSFFKPLQKQAALGGIILTATTVLALLSATLLGTDTFHHFWTQPFSFSIGNDFELTLTRHHWVNDGLMVLFFFLVGLELKREILIGELASLRHAVLPMMAAVGGMIFPAGIYFAFNRDLPASAGWGIPMATDIAFAIGILALLGKRITKSLVIFLTALAIADDLGAVLVIALFYTANLNKFALIAIILLFVILLVLNKMGARHLLPYLLVGLILWYAVLLSGIHATIAGILVAMTIPANRTSTEAQSPLQYMEHSLAPWVTFAVIPIFIFCNAGIDLTDIQWSNALSQKITVGIIAGLVLGKFIGISLFCLLTIQLNLGRLPLGVSWKQLLGVAWLGGIGFTMSLFISQLAFTNQAFINQAKLGILLASATSAIIGIIWLYCATEKNSN